MTRDGARFALAVLGALGALTPSDATASLAPHRALYSLSLDNVRASSEVTGVDGTMVFEWADACDGWAIQQRMALRFTYAQGNLVPIESAVMMWEAKDASSYAFTVRKTVNGQNDASFQGRAEMHAKEDGLGWVRYSLPKEKEEIALSAETLFPSGHTELIISKALAGENFFSRRVFDGSDETGFADVSAFIGPEISKEEPLPKGVADNSLLKSRAWPVRLAFFDPKAPQDTPDYEMDLVLQENGVARNISIDYGDFKIKGTLKKLDSSVSSLCPGP